MGKFLVDDDGGGGLHTPAMHLHTIKGGTINH